MWSIENTDIQTENIQNNENFLEKAMSSLEDNILSEQEKAELNQMLQEYNLENWEIQNETREQLSEIKNEIELKDIIKNSELYSEINEQMSNLSRNEIKNIQYITGSIADWIYWINTFIAYKNSPISEIFTPEQIASGREVWENVSSFIENFSKLNSVDSELLAIILSNDISSNSFVFIDENWNITIMDKQNNNNIVTFSETLSVESLVHESFIKKDINIIKSQLDLLANNSDKNSYILKMRNIISEYNYQREARQIFSQNTSNWTEIILPNSHLNREMKAVDLFWDYSEITIDWEKYTNDWEEFFTSEWKRLAIYNRQVLNIENFWTQTNSQEINENNSDNKKVDINLWENSFLDNLIQEDNSINNIENNNENIENNLSREFWDWLQNEWVNLLGRTWENSCWLAVHQLIDTFMRSNWIRNAINIRTARNGANFDSILEGWNINVENPFITQRNNNIYKINSPEELKNAWIDIEKIINKNITINSRSINYPKESIPWEILVYNENAESNNASNIRRNFWHVEIKWSDNMYYSYYKSNNPWWSASENENLSPEEYSRLTGFNGKAYSIELT